MKNLAILVQPERSGGADLSKKIRELATAIQANAASEELEITEGNDGGSYTNIVVSSQDLGLLWADISGLIVNDEQLAKCSIVCCEGEHGWDDYLLLYHFDANEAIDPIS